MTLWQAYVQVVRCRIGLARTAVKLWFSSRRIASLEAQIKEHNEELAQLRSEMEKEN